MFSTTLTSLPSSLKTFAQACQIFSTGDPEIAIAGSRIPRHSAMPGRSCLRSRSQRSFHFLAVLGRSHKCLCPSPISKGSQESQSSELIWLTTRPVTQCSPIRCRTDRHRLHPRSSHSPLLARPSDSFCSYSFFSSSFSCHLSHRS